MRRILQAEYIKRGTEVHWDYRKWFLCVCVWGWACVGRGDGRCWHCISEHWCCLCGVCVWFNPPFRSQIRSLSRCWSLLLVFLALHHLLSPYQTIHIINPFLLLSLFYPITHTHTHTPFWKCSTLLFLGISTSCWKSAFSKALATPIQPQTPPFHFHIPLAPFRVLFPTAFSPTNTQVLTNTDNILVHTHTDLLPFFSLGWSGLCCLFTKLTLKCWPGRTGSRGQGCISLAFSCVYVCVCVFGGKSVCWVGYLNFEGIRRAGVKERGGKQKDKKKLVFFVKKKSNNYNYIVHIAKPTVAILDFFKLYHWCYSNLKWRGKEGKELK